MSKHILLAEDEQETRNTFTAILKNAGYDVTVVADGSEALDHLKAAADWERNVDLVITDVVMKGLSGLQLLDEMNKEGINVPTLVMTGYGDERLISELASRGCKHFIEKPFEAATFVSKIAGMIGE